MQSRSAVHTLFSFTSVLLLAALLLAQQPKHTKSSSAMADGQHTFASACASCHGLDGRGGERAPNIAQAASVQRLSDEQLTRIITDGVAGTGMPGFHYLGSSGISAVVKYLRVLQGRNQPSTLPGDAVRGQALFTGQAGCSNCHMVGGKGGFLAADLSAYGKRHSVDEIREAIVNPSRNSEVHAKHAIVTAADGQQYDGLVRNEDNFSIQLQTMDGTFHFFNRADLQKVDYQKSSVMPSDYATRLNRNELNDIVSYLMDVAKNSNIEPSAENEE